LIIAKRQDDAARGWLNRTIDEYTATVKDTRISHAVALDTHQIDVRGPNIQKFVQRNRGLMIVSGWAWEAACSCSRENLDELV